MKKIIKENGTEIDITEGGPLSLEYMQKTVGGYIETIQIDKDTFMIVDEEGLLKGKKHNIRASHLAGQPIVGDVIVCDKRFVE